MRTAVAVEISVLDFWRITPAELEIAVLGYCDRRYLDAHFTAAIMMSMGAKVEAHDIFKHPDHDAERTTLNQFTKEGKDEINKRLEKLG